ncbi:MAG: DNA-protecting protein DprA [Fibrobacteria bacterium]|nr:DNA-protecting protein DprA [Fibrobacteria bacterium]
MPFPPITRPSRSVRRPRVTPPLSLWPNPSSLVASEPLLRNAPADTTLGWLGLLHLEGLGPIRLARLWERFGSIGTILQASEAALLEAGLPRELVLRLSNGLDLVWAQDQVHRTRDLGARIVCLGDPDYPALLAQIPSPPPVLWILGNLPLESDRAVAVVGTRLPTTTGLQACRELVHAWSANGIRIVSGMARGIDQAAHRATLEHHGETIAVLGSPLAPLARLPRGDLLREILRKGAILSEFPLGEPIHKGNFPRRNRIISGLSQAVVVLEAGEKSGALITAQYALDQGREVLACPGPPGWPSFAGCHRLLRQGATLCASAHDLTTAMNWTSPLRAALEPENGFLHLLTGPGATVEEIAAKMGTAIPDIQLELVMKELEGRVWRDSSGRWHRSP